MQCKVEDIRQILEANGLVCWVDISTTNISANQRGNSGMSTASHRTSEANNETLQSHIQRNMKAAGVVLSCITPKYMQSDNCVKDLTMAEHFHKSIIPVVLLRFCPWPPESAPIPVKNILVKYTPIDLSNETLFNRNMPLLLDKIKKYLGVK